MVGSSRRFGRLAAIAVIVLTFAGCSSAAAPTLTFTTVASGTQPATSTPVITPVVTAAATTTPEPTSASRRARLRPLGSST